MKAKQGFLAGMDQDTATNKRNPMSYYKMSNFRVVTNEGMSSGSIENERGTLFSFEVPDLAQMILTDGTVIPAQTNLRIIGWGTIVDTIILFTTNETSATPNGSYGQIWKLEYDEATNTVIGLVGDELDPTVHLVYNQMTNFSSYHRIGRVVGRYENIEIQRVYWTDNYNPVRVINTVDPDSLDIPLDNIDLIPGVTFAQPNIDSIGIGNLPQSSRAQFGYRLLDSGGGETLYSPLSTLTSLTDIDIYTVGYGSFNGSVNQLNTRSVTYTITGLDTDYTVIEHIIVLYDELDVKTIYKFDENSVPATGNITVVCNSIEEAIEIPLVEFNILSSGFDIAKDIEVKDNRLIAANTKTKEFNIDFDARAYRFNSSQQSLLKDISGDITLNGPIPAYNTVPEDHDAINVYNQENSVTWFASLNQYKFKSDGLTLGGSGLNISYEFTTQDMVSNTNTGYTQSPDHVAVPRFAPNATPLTLGVLEPDGSPKLIQIGSQFKNFASQWADSNFVGYTRGETYRFGIVFYSKKGSPSFVKWIGDIRFPDVTDGYPLQTLVAGVPTLQSLGIEFDVDVSSIADQISSYSIVRVKREEIDKTKIGSGMLMFFDIQDRAYYHSLAHRWETTGPNSTAANPDHPYEYTDEVEIPGGAVNDGNYHLGDKPGFNVPQLNFATAKRVTYLLSPLGEIYWQGFRSGDYIDTRGYYTAPAVLYANSQDTDSDNEAKRKYGFYYKLGGFVANPYTRERFEIGNSRPLREGEYIFSGTDIIDTYTGVNNLMNASASKDQTILGNTANTVVPFGIGSIKLAMMLDDSPTITNNTGDPGNLAADAGNMRWLGSNWCGPDFSGGTALEFDGGYVTNSNVNFKEVVYARYVNNQYGGNTFVDRSKNQYIETNHYQVIDNLPAAEVLTFKVYGGDTYVNYYDTELMTQYWNIDGVYNAPYKDAADNKLSVAVTLPTESTINTDYISGRRWASSRRFDNMGAYQNNSTVFNQVYKQENSTYDKFFEKDFLLKAVEEHPHQLWASQLKIDGELVDNWRSFKTNDATEVTGIYGPINRIITFRDNLYFYQDKAFGVASINERSIIQDESGQALVLGTGGIFPSYTYISVNTGSYHQFSVTNSESAIYHYDAGLRKVFKFNGQGLTPISDSCKMSSFFYNNVINQINKKDFTLKEDSEGAIGVHAIPDYRYNRILFTFLNSKGNDDTFENNFTISYNEALDAFEAFYDYTPGLYLQYGRRLLSVSPFEKNKVHINNEGDYGVYYDQAASISLINTTLSDKGDIVKTCNNIEYSSELYDNTGIDIYNETFGALRIYNNYQDSGAIPLIVSNDIIPATTGAIRRRMRTWRYTLPRELGSTARFRNNWFNLQLTYQNNNNKRIILHEIIYSYTPAPN